MLEAMMSKSGVLESERMGGAFAMLRARELLWKPAVDQYVRGERPQLNDLMAWNADGTRMPCRMHGEYLERLYLKNELARGTFTLKGRKVDLARITVPMFVVGTETDHVAPWRSVYKLARTHPQPRLYFSADQRRTQRRHRQRSGEPEAPPPHAHLVERPRHAPARGMAEAGNASRGLVVAGVAAVAGLALERETGAPARAGCGRRRREARGRPGRLRSRDLT